MIKDLFAFSKDIVEQDSDFFMEILDADSLLLRSWLKRLLTSALIYFFKVQKKQKVYEN